MTIEQIAEICHEVNRMYCVTINDRSQKSWNDAQQWQRDSAIAGVNFVINNPDAKPSCQHEAWVADKLKNGWKYGPTKNETIKEHPCIVSYDELSIEQRIKDSLFNTIVKILIPLL